VRDQLAPKPSRFPHLRTKSDTDRT
jgi:hypothetical protein